jgi:hypothetical protein
MTRRLYVDPELTTASKMLELLTLHHPPGRRRILGMVNARAPSLPYMGSEPETNEDQAEMFDETDPPMMPPLKGARKAADGGDEPEGPSP